jgi:hypothetical protein
VSERARDNGQKISKKKKMNENSKNLVHFRAAFTSSFSKRTVKRKELN